MRNLVILCIFSTFFIVGTSYGTPEFGLAGTCMEVNYAATEDREATSRCYDPWGDAYCTVASPPPPGLVFGAEKCACESEELTPKYIFRSNDNVLAKDHELVKEHVLVGCVPRKG